MAELSASSVDSQFPVDPHAAHGAPRRVARPRPHLPSTN